VHALTFFSTCSAHALTVKQAAATVLQIVALTPATSNSKDDSNHMTHNHRFASNSMNESNSRTANTVGTPTTAGTIAKVMKPLPECREDKHNMDTFNMR
jgi:hypothetical protein